MASRASIATGLYEYRTGCNFEHGRMPPELFEQSYHCLLRDAGYFTGYAGKFGFGLQKDGYVGMTSFSYHDQEALPGAAFDWWRGLPGQGDYDTAKNPTMCDVADDYPHLTRALGCVSGEFFDQALESGKPFCLSIGFKAPHDPPTPDPYFDSVYADTDFPVPGNYGDAGAEHLAPHIRTGRQWALFEREWEGEKFTPKNRNYFQLISGVDYAVGMIRAALEARGLADNTVIVYTSDNGYFCGSHRLGGKVLLYEEGSRVPMIIHDPRHTSTGRRLRVQSVSANIDIAPTILELAGLSAPKHMDGVSLLPLLDQPGSSLHDAVSLLNTWNMPPTQSLAVTDGTYKYLYYWYQGEGMSPAEELYDLRDDPLEMRNLTKDAAHGDALARMRQHYDRAVAHIRENAIAGNHYEHYGVLFDRRIPWAEKRETYQAFFEKWLRIVPSWRGGKWFEDLDLSGYPEEVTYCFGRKYR